MNIHLHWEKFAQAGWRTYQRPEDKSGGHGVGWSPIIPYTFSVPQDWDEVIRINTAQEEVQLLAPLFLFLAFLMVASL